MGIRQDWLGNCAGDLYTNQGQSYLGMRNMGMGHPVFVSGKLWYHIRYRHMSLPELPIQPQKMLSMPLANAAKKESEQGYVFFLTSERETQ